MMTPLHQKIFWKHVFQNNIKNDMKIDKIRHENLKHNINREVAKISVLS